MKERIFDYLFFLSFISIEIFFPHKRRHTLLDREKKGQKERKKNRSGKIKRGNMKEYEREVKKEKKCFDKEKIKLISEKGKKKSKNAEDNRKMVKWNLFLDDIHF